MPSSGPASFLSPPGGCAIADVRNTLASIVAEHGPGVADDERKLDALLTAACGPRSTQEVLLIVSAAMAGVPSTLRAKGVAPDGEIIRLARKLQKEFGVSEPLAQWAVDAWANALNIPRKSVLAAAGSTAAPSGSSISGAFPSDDVPPASSGAADSDDQISAETLRDAIREAKADGVISAEEREKLATLAAKVRARLGQSPGGATAGSPSGATTSAQPIWKRPPVLAAAAAALVALIALGAWALLRTGGPAVDPAVVAREADRKKLVEAVEARRAEWRTLDESINVVLKSLATSGATHHANARDVADFADRLERAARTANDQGRDQFRVGGQAYTQVQAARVIEAARRYAAERKSLAESGTTRAEAIAKLRSDVSAAQQALDATLADDKMTLARASAPLATSGIELRRVQTAVDALRAVPTTAPAAFDVAAAIRAASQP